jgi:hypothetical protein
VGLRRQQLSEFKRALAPLSLRFVIFSFSRLAPRGRPTCEAARREIVIDHGECPSKRPNDYRSGRSYALATAVLVSFQEPFFSLAARSLTSIDFVSFTQIALLFSIPLLILRMDSRRDFAAIVFGVRNWPELCVIFLVGAAGLRSHSSLVSSSAFVRR